MNLNKGIFRIWLIIVPIVWIVSFIYVAQDIYYPNYSCDRESEKNCQCVYTLGNKKYTEWCGWGVLFRLECNLNYKSMGYKDVKSCESFFRNAKRTKTCSLDEAKVKSCESQKDKKRADYISAMIGVIIFPLTFYPIYLGLRRLFIWVREGFKK